MASVAVVACSEASSPPEVVLVDEELAYAIALGEALEDEQRDLDSLARLRPESFDRAKLEMLRFRPDANGRSLAQQAPVPFSFDRAGWRAEWAAPGREARFEGVAEEDLVVDTELASVWRPIAMDYYALLRGVLRSHEQYDELQMLTVTAGGMLIVRELAATVPDCQITEEFATEYKKLAKEGDFDGVSRMLPPCITGLAGEAD